MTGAPDTPDDVSGPDIRSLVARGISWKAISYTFRYLAKIVVVVTLARLLGVRAYGLAAMAITFSGLVLVFADLGFGAALVQRRRLSETDRSTVFWFSCMAGCVCTGASIGLSPLVGWYFRTPAVVPLCAALSLSFFITSIASVQSALLTREMNFRSLELRVIGGTFVGGAVGIVIAALHGGAWAIIGQQLAIAAVSSMLLWVVTPWRPRFVFSRASLRDLGRFSSNVFGTRLLFYLNRNADNLLIGRFLGAASLGAYNVAYNVMLVPLSDLAGPIREVLFPAFSRMQDDRERMAAMWIKANRLVGAASIPALAGLIVVAPDFVHVVLGDKWRAATPVIQILAWVGMLQSVQGLNSSILQACDRTGELFRYSIYVLIASLIAFVGGLHWGIVGVATGYAISSTLAEPYYTWLTGRAVGVSVWQFVRSLSGVVQASLVMVAAILPARLLLVHDGIGAPVRFAAVVALGILVFAPVCLWRTPELRDDLGRLRPRRRPGAPGLPGTSPQPTTD
ncbi:MAG: MOP flippase family protein [Gaiellaceae bacterium]